MLISQRNRDLLAASRYSALPSIVRLQQKADVHGQVSGRRKPWLLVTQNPFAEHVGIRRFLQDLCLKFPNKPSRAILQHRILGVWHAKELNGL